MVQNLTLNLVENLTFKNVFFSTCAASNFSGATIKNDAFGEAHLKRDKQGTNKEKNTSFHAFETSVSKTNRFVATLNLDKNVFTNNKRQESKQKTKEQENNQKMKANWV